MCTISFVLLFSILTIVNDASAQNPVENRIDLKLKGFEKNGSSISRNIRDLAIDDFGFAWLATDRGVVRFDGSHFFEINKQNIDLFFPGSAVDYLLHHDQELYLVSESEGLLSLNTETFEINYLIDKGVYSIAIDRLNNLLYAFTIDNQLLEIINGEPIREIVVGDDFGLIEVTDNGLYLLVKNNAVYHIDRENFELTNLTEEYEYPKPTGFRESISRLADETVLLYTNRSLIKVANGNFSEPKNISVCNDSNDYLLLEKRSSIDQSTYEGYNLCNNILYRGGLGDQLQREEVKRIDANLDIFRMVKVNQDDLLLATNQGVRLLNIASGKILSVDDGIVGLHSEPRVRRAIVELDNNELLLLGGPEIYKMDMSGNVELQKNENNFLYFDAIGIDNAIYATTEGQGFVKLNDKGEVVDQVFNRDDSNDIFYSIQELNENYLIAGSKGYVSIINKDLSLIDDLPISAISKHIRNDDVIMDILIDNRNRGVWLATESGLSLFDKDLSNEIQFYSNSSQSDVKLNNRSISSLLQSVTGDTLWIGGNKGIDVIDIGNESYVRFIENWNKNANTKVTGLVKDHSGNIWASTFDGIIVFNKEEDDIFTIDRNMGLINQEFNYKSLLLTQNGKVVMGGVSGYDVIDTSIIYQDYSSDIYLTKVEFNSAKESIVEPYFINSKSELPIIRYRTDKKSVRLFFSVLDLSFSDRYVIEYKLDNSFWQKVDDKNSIMLNNLAYGTYRLNIRARNPLGQILKNDINLLIDATVPFYYKSAFHIIIVLFISSIIIGFLYVVAFNYKRESKIKDRISMDLHDVVGTTLTRSAILMQEYMEPSNRHHQRVLKNLKESQFTLRSFITTMSIHELTFDELILELRDTLFQLLSHEIKFELKIEENSGYRTTYSGELFRDIKNSLYELCTNTIKHANAKNIHITINQINNHLILEFKDDGDLKDLCKLESEEGFGLKNLKKRLDHHHGELITGITELGTGLKLILKFKI